MNRYRVNVVVASLSHTRIIDAVNAGLAVHKARKSITDDGWLPEHITSVQAVNIEDAYDCWNSIVR